MRGAGWGVVAREAPEILSSARSQDQVFSNRCRGPLECKHQIRPSPLLSRKLPFSFF